MNYGDLFAGFNPEQLRRLTCPHSETTPEDGAGRAVCVRCRAVVAVRLTREMLDAAFEKLRRG